MQMCRWEREINEPDMNFTREGHGRNMGFSRERHEKHMGKTRCLYDEAPNLYRFILNSYNP